MARPPAARFAEPIELYDLCHQWVDHAAHGARMAEALRAAGLPEGATVLEGACGTGLWLSALGPGWRRAGFDLDRDSLSRAQARIPDGRFFEADLADWRVERPVDAVLLVFGALAYVPDAALAGAAACVAQALAPGGVALVEPWVAPADFQPGRPQLVVVDTPYLKVCRQVLPRRDGDAAVLDFHHLITAAGLPPRLVRTTDRLVLRDDAVLDAALQGAGLHLEDRIPGTMPGRTMGLWRRPA